MAKASTQDLVLGIVLTILGVLMLIDRLKVPYLAEIAAIALVVVGVLMLMGRMRGKQCIAIVAIVAGIVIILVGQFAAAVGALLNIALGVLLLIAGILKLVGKW